MAAWVLTGSTDMPFNSWRDYDDFAYNVKSHQRFIHSDTVRKFLNAVEETLNRQAVSLNVNTVLYRSQLGADVEENEGVERWVAYRQERMKPTARHSTEGRANSKGICHLYLADRQETSMAELRPQVGQLITCGTFQLVRDISLVNCYTEGESYYNLARCIFSAPNTQNDIDNAVWSRINDAFSSPVGHGDAAVEYVPTQILAELFKSRGFDGLLCKSHLGEGFNVTLFDIEAAVMKVAQVHECRGVKYNFEPSDNPSFFDVESKNLGFQR